jgi:hypothetical protein
MDIIGNFNLRRSQVIKKEISRSKAGFSVYLYLHHQNNRLENSSLSVSNKNETLFRKNIAEAFSHPSYTSQVTPMIIA